MRFSQKLIKKNEKILSSRTNISKSNIFFFLKFLPDIRRHVTSLHAKFQDGETLGLGDRKKNVIEVTHFSMKIAHFMHFFFKNCRFSW